jgi:alkaline phosphatase D
MHHDAVITPARREAGPDRAAAGQPSLDRRTLLQAGAATAALTTAIGAVHGGPASAASRYFRHGVASGDPLAHRVVLWTRVTPTEAAQPGSGRGPRVTVRWQVARDRAFTQVVSRGRAVTGPARDHTVKVDAGGLKPDTQYYYRFLYDGRASAVGRTRTAPAADADNGNLRFGMVSCANWQAGWFSAYRHLANRDDLDLVIHLGDYLYEYAPGEYGYGPGDEDIRTHVPPKEIVSLADYRQRHAQYKSDPDLQRLHTKYAFVVTWDDHESANDSWADGAENHQPDGEGSWAARKAAARRAYDEWMPVRMADSARLNDGTRLFRRLRFGRLAELSMLDLRSYRSAQVTLQPDPAADDPSRTMTGERQMEWLKESLHDDRALWKLVGNPVMIAPVRIPEAYVDEVSKIVETPAPKDGPPYNVDQWDGYTADRRELFTHIRDHGVNNAVFLTGDIHSGWACDLPYDAESYALGTPLGTSVATEFVCSSITSSNLKDITGDFSGTTSTAVVEGVKLLNRHVKYLNFDDHGFSVVDIDRERLQVDWFVISDRRDKNATAHRDTSFVTRVGSNRVERVDQGVAG